MHNRMLYHQYKSIQYSFTLCDYHMLYMITMASVQYHYAFTCTHVDSIPLYNWHLLPHY